MNALDRALVAPAAEVLPDDLPGRQVMGQVAPLTASASLIEDGIPDLAQGIGAPASGAPAFSFGQDSLNLLPLGIRQIAGVS